MNTDPQRKSSPHIFISIIILLLCALGIGGAYFWQHSKVVELTIQSNNYQQALIKNSKLALDKFNAQNSLPNVVEDSATSPADLIAFLGADNTQCYKNDGKGYYKVIAQTADKFAKLQYGCTAKNSTTPLGAAPTYILAKKTDTKWSLISPTNQWQTIGDQAVPSCKMVNDNKISRVVVTQCYVASTTASRPTLQPVTNP